MQAPGPVVVGITGLLPAFEDSGARTFIILHIPFWMVIESSLTLVIAPRDVKLSLHLRVAE